ncbi:hypothetical protein ZWY2020_043218 [Hordeum vulgare]|nr:hypothetical protein ZWY2020_043218 [Hordeum vulgare]
MPRLPLYLRPFVTRRRRRFIAPQRFDGRRFGIGNYGGRRNAGGYRARRPGMGRFRGQNFPNRRRFGPATAVMTQPTPAASAARHAPARATAFTMGSDVRTLTSDPAAPLSLPHADVDEPRLPSPTPATPPPSPRRCSWPLGLGQPSGLRQ